jgi:UDP-glucose 4-epimerase
LSAPAADYRGARALVTGGLGFIGSHLAARLVELGAEVTIIDSLVPGHGGNRFNVRKIEDQVRIEVADLRDAAALSSVVPGQDVIFNLAGQVSHLDSMEDPETDLEINCRAQLRLLEAWRELSPRARIVFSASRQQYGPPQRLPVAEDHPLVPVDVNGVNLVAAEDYHLLYHRAYDLPAVSLRLTNTYGPHLLVKHARQGFIAVFIRRALEGQDIEVYGDGSQLRDLTYVSDVVEALLLAGATETVVGRALNVGGVGPVSLIEVARLCQEVAGGGGEVRTVPWPEQRARIDVGSVYLDHSAFTEATGWSPTVELREGLERTMDFLRRHGEHYF